MSSFVKAAVLGHPIKHSKSPLIHNYWIEKHGLEGSYEAIDIAPENFEREVRELFESGYAGFNVTIPHKEAAYKLCDELSHTAEQVGAVNTLYMRSGKIHGDNTDVFGFAENVKTAARGFGFAWNMAYGPALVLGAGGAARGIIQGLLDEKVPEIIVANRTREKAEALQDMHKDAITVIDWHERSDILGSMNLLVNTTALGMEGQPALEINLEHANEDLLVTDIVYTPLMTPLLQQARAQDLRIVTGIGMLLHQARPSFQKWFGILPQVDEELEERVLSA